MLWGCGSAPTAPIAVDDRIECARGGGSFARECSIERSRDQTITLRHADGGFRRIVSTAKGQWEAADGSEVGDLTSLPDGSAEFRIAGDRYRLPPQK